MKKTIFLLLFVFTATDLLWSAEPYKATPITTFKDKQEENDYYFRRGRVLVGGGYQEKAVWGKMVALIGAPPEEVWHLFIATNNWRNYRLPNLRDARVVNASISQKAAATKNVEDFYRVLGGQVIPNETGRVKGGRWVDYTFQYFNVPWPISDRWMILQDKNDETHAGEGIFRSEWTLAAGNVKTMDGYIALSPFEGNPNVTRMEYKTLTDPDAHVPKFLLKWGLYRVMPDVIKAIRRQVQHPSIALGDNV